MAASSYLTNPMSQYYAAGAAMHERGRVFQSNPLFIKPVVMENLVQGDQSGCSLGVVDFKTKVAF